MDRCDCDHCLGLNYLGGHACQIRLQIFAGDTPVQPCAGYPIQVYAMFSRYARHNRADEGATGGAEGDR